MIVRNGKKFAFPIQYPSFPVGGLALWAMPVAAGVVTDGLLLAVTTFGDMSTECSCSAE